MRPTAEEIRAKIVEAKQNKIPTKEIMKMLNVNGATISLVWHRYLETGKYSAIPYKGRKSKLTAEQNAAIKAKVLETPNITAKQLIAELSLSISPTGVYHQLAKMGMTYRQRISILEEQEHAKAVKKREE